MGGLARSRGRSMTYHNYILQLGLLVCLVVLSQLNNVSTDAATTNFAYGRRMRDAAELEGPIARYRQFITQEKISLRNLLQEDKKNNDEHQDVDQEKIDNNEQTILKEKTDEKTQSELDGKEPDIFSAEFQRDHNAMVQGTAAKIAASERRILESDNIANSENAKPAQSGMTAQEKKGLQEEQVQQEKQISKEEKSNLQEENQKSGTESERQQEGQQKDNSAVNETKQEEKKDEPFVFPEPYLLGPTIEDWDEQRESWFNANPQMRTKPGGKPRVLIVTGSQPEPCSASRGDNFHIKSLKLKIDYARMHNYEIYYNLAFLDPLFDSFWVKLPTIRTLMLAHPEIEWFFWVDSDAMFTDMLFEAPWETYEGSNMIMWGLNDYFYKEKHWTSFNAGVFLIRNCQWSLDLIDKWSPMGPDGPVRVAYGKVFQTILKSRNDWPSDDQSALAYLMITDEAVKAKVKLVDSPEYMISGWWVAVVDTYEDLMEKYHPGLGNNSWPWITHFTGCGPCYHANDDTDGARKCMKNIERAFNFADNQVLAYMGFQHQSLSSPDVIRLRNETDRPLEHVGVNPWAKRIAQLAASST